ncbi:MAG: gluconate 2-dehydrogenase subunit 3 family protein [Acidobacteria bacterium]|nr:gluconate 2-dehydrogenase subunit 3 family protein [Acidobacteriota bacterium]
MADRRDALKIIGAIGATCAFPFSADELYGQHEHGSSEPAGPPAKPSFFTRQELETVECLAGLIIPPTGTPGAVEAGVPMYIDFVVAGNQEWKTLFREGLAWLDQQARAKHGKHFRELSEAVQTALLAPLCEAADRMRAPSRSSRRRKDAAIEIQFFKAFKSMTADGYFTSRAGLVDTLGYKGNTVLEKFPACE